MAENHKIPMSIALDSKFIWIKEEEVWKGRKGEMICKGEITERVILKRRNVVLRRQYGALIDEIHKCNSSGYLLKKNTSK